MFVVSEQDVVTLWEPTCAEVSGETAVLDSQRCRISTLWLGPHLADSAKQLPGTHTGLNKHTPNRPHPLRGKSKIGLVK